MIKTPKLFSTAVLIAVDEYVVPPVISTSAQAESLPLIESKNPATYSLLSV